MNNYLNNSVLAVCLASAHFCALAQLNVPSDGSDGMLNITTNTVIDLRLASRGSWDMNNQANTGNGVYDSNKWAVVFKYKSVNIDAGATNTFLNHESRAPVVWIVQGDVTINGVVTIDGKAAASTIPETYTPSEPGPGGFRGGASSPLGSGAGYGIGGGYSDTQGGSYAGVYGNPQILPLIGGSGGHPYSPFGAGVSSGAGGGAILVVAGGNVTINGSISAKGGVGYYYYQSLAGGGAAGAIRVVADKVLGWGNIDASAISGGTAGRTRIEANSLAPTLNIFPNVSAVPPGTTPVIWPPDSAATVRVLSVDTQPAPADPLAAVAGTADIPIQNNGPVDILLETKNLPTNGVVSVRLNPKYGQAVWLNAAIVSGDINIATWKATTTPPAGFFTLQARATAP